MHNYNTTTRNSEAPKRRLAQPVVAVATLAMLLLTACETPSEVSPAATHASGLSHSTAAAAPSIVAVAPDGSLRPVYEEEEGIALGVDGNPGVALEIAGRATYGAGNVSMLRLTVRQKRNGEIAGGGTATIYGQDVDLIAECIKPITSFGMTYYGVNVAFAEPLVRTTPWGTVTYTHGALSVADGGDLANLVMAGSSGCRAAALRYPYEPETGRINVNVAGQ